MKPLLKLTRPDHIHPERVIFLDTESYPINISLHKTTKALTDIINIQEHVLSFGWAFYNEYDYGKKDYVRREESLFSTPEEFVKILIDKVIEVPDKPLYIFSHNMSYDFRVIKTYENREFLDFSAIKEYANKEFLHNGFQLKTAISKNVFIYKYVHIIEKYQIIFLSSTNYFHVALKNLGKTFHLEKLDFPFDEQGFEETRLKTQKAIDYCFRDVEILEKACVELFKFIYNENTKFAYTLASISFTAFRTNFYNQSIVMHKMLNIELLEKLSYYGGRTDCFKIGVFKNIYKLDVNSMYSGAMLDNYYPVKLICSMGIEEDGRKPTKEQLLNYLKNKEYLIIAEVKVKLDIDNAKVPYRDLSNTKEQKLIYPDGIFNTTLCQPELEILNDSEILDVKKILIYRKDKIFKDFVTYFYNMRLKYKEEKNDVMQYFCKILLSANYGKFAQKQHKQVLKPEFDNKLINGKMTYLDVENNLLYDLMFINGVCFELLNETYNENSFVPVSAFVTSYARVLLFNLIKLVKQYLIYVDTDSLFVVKEGYDILMENNWVDHNELGKLKLEDILKELRTRTLKDYTTVDGKNNVEYKIKGIKKASIEKAIKNDEDIDSKTEWVINRFIGFNESQRYFNLLVGTVDEKKYVTHQYTKGIVDKNGNVHPITLN